MNEEGNSARRGGGGGEKGKNVQVVKIGFESLTIMSQCLIFWKRQTVKL